MQANLFAYGSLHYVTLEIKPLNSVITGNCMTNAWRLYHRSNIICGSCAHKVEDEV